MRPLARLEAFGLGNALVAWGIANGGFDDVCDYCRGPGIVIDSPCREREDPERCSLETGCAKCRRKCPICRGSGLSRDDVVMAEDFGDAESRAAAERMFPGLEVDDLHKRIDMNARAM